MPGRRTSHPVAAKAARTTAVLGQPSWRIASDRVEAFVTRLGGHLGPVTFDRTGGKIRPLSVAPWHDEPKPSPMPPVLRVLRGDFFCMPFGGNERRYRREKHPPHGETANAAWSLVSQQRKDGESALTLRLRTRIRAGVVKKRIRLLDGHDVVYQRHTISNMAGPMSFGHHPMLKFPDDPGSGILSTSRFLFGQVYPGVLERPEAGGYSILKPGAEFESLQRVPTITGESADLSRYPARRGYEDLVMLIADPSEPLGWSAVTFPKQRYVWFALRDPRVLRQTILWISNGGRHYPPWNGRHVGVMGIEEVTSYFHEGLAESAAANALSRRGIPTHVVLDPQRPLAVSYLFGVAPIPARFDRVERIEPSAGGITLVSSSGKQVKTAVDMGWIAPA